MLHRIQPPNTTDPSLPLSAATSPHPFPSTLEYSPAARGTWNIVHTGMLLPESHQIYICGNGCLRGVILTAAEMGESYYRRFHTLELRESDLYATDPETFLIDGITNILQRLPKLPPAVLVFTACVHHFLGVSLPYVYRTLRRRFPTVQFAECIMDPIRQTKNMPPETRERLEIARLLSPAKHDRSINLIGNNLSLSPESDLAQILRRHGFHLRDFPPCRTYADFQSMSKSCANIYMTPITKPAADDLERRLHQPSLYLPPAWTYEEIEQNLHRLETFLEKLPPLPPDGRAVAAPRPRLQIATLELRFDALRHQLEGRPIALDYTFTPLPFSLARLLVSHGFNVTELYADAIAPDDEPNFRWLKTHAPSIRLSPTKHPAMRTQPRAHRDAQGRLPIALGQKAAYFTGTRHFLPHVEAGGHYGLEAIHWLQTALSHAALLETDPEPILRRKAYGAPSCI